LCGKAYFIGDKDPVELWDFVGKLLKTQKVEWIPRSVPYSLAYSVGAMFELLYTCIGSYHNDPPLTRFAVFSLAKSHYFDHRAAKRDFGYAPKISTEEGLRTMLGSC